VVRQVWIEVSNWTAVSCLHPQHLNPGWGVPVWFAEVAGQTSSAREKGIQSLLILVCWSLWHERNAPIFDDLEKHQSRVVAEIKDETRFWVRAGAKPSH
jgi:hypothetical protein